MEFIFINACTKTKYKKYNLDFEYNKNLDDVKRTKIFSNGTYPDLILHKRGSNDGNILVLEFKTWWNNNSNSNKDIEKLEDFVNQDGKYRYKFAGFVRFEKEIPEVMIIKGETK